MFNKKGGALNVWTYMLVIFISVIFIYSMTHIGSFLNSPSTALSTNSLTYLGNISGQSNGNLTEIDSNAGNNSVDEKWAFALSFLRLYKKVDAVKEKISYVANLPSFIVFTVLQVPQSEEYKYMIDVIFNFIGWATFLALIYLLWK